MDISGSLSPERSSMIAINSDDDFGIKTTSIRNKVKMIYQGIKCGCGQNSGFPHGDVNVDFTDKGIICKNCGNDIFYRAHCLNADD